MQGPATARFAVRLDLRGAVDVYRNRSRPARKAAMLRQGEHNADIAQHRRQAGPGPHAEERSEVCWLAAEATWGVKRQGVECGCDIVTFAACYISQSLLLQS